MGGRFCAFTPRVNTGKTKRFNRYILMNCRANIKRTLSDTRGDWNALWAVTHNQFTIASRYSNRFRIELLGHLLIFLPIALTAWVFADGRGASFLEELTGLPDQFTFITLGFVAFTVLGIGNMILQDSNVAGGISYEMMTGTFERILAAPIRRLTIILGITNYFLILFSFHAVTPFVGAWLLFGFESQLNLGPEGIVLAIAAVLFLLVLNLSLGIIGASLTMTFRDAQVYLLAIHRPAAILSGAYFLIEILPQPFRFLGYINPIAYAVDVFREALIGKTLILESVYIELGILAGMTVAAFMLASFLYSRLMQSLQQRGTLALF